jgi:hypothetical protein
MSFIIHRKLLTLSVAILSVLVLSSCGQKPKESASTGQNPSSNTGASTSAPTTPTLTPAASSNAAMKKPSTADLKLGVLPQDKTTCPSGDPIKGKITKKHNKIYHVPKSPDYDKVKPDICFPDTAMAEKAGYNAPK